MDTSKEGVGKKRLYTGMVAAGLLVGSVAIASAAQTPATQNAAAQTPVAQTATTPAATEDEATSETETQEPTYTGSVQAPADDPSAEANETEDAADDPAAEAAESASLQALAKISASDAEAKALAAVPGTVQEVELENENGSVVYSVQITDAAGKAFDVKIDAGNGAVLSQQSDDDGDEVEDESSEDAASEAAEGPETTEDATSGTTGG